jgi:ubiquinone biosynthesis accessory factor UbiJ
MAIKALLMHALEIALNQYLSLDPNASTFLAPLAGKVIKVTISSFNESLYLCPSADAIQLLDFSSEPVDTQLTGSVFAFGLMGLSSKPMRSIFSGDIQIEGDMQIGRKFQTLFSKLDINLEPHLARYTGDSVAQHISHFFRSGHEWSKESIESFRLNVSEYLQDETRDLPSEPEVAIFYNQVDELRTHFDRLSSRIERLEKTLLNKPLKPTT